MKIAHVVSTYPPYRGGMGNVAFAYTEWLRSHGYNVHVFTPRFGPAIADDPDYVHRIPSPMTIGNAAAVPSLFGRLKGFDIVHLHYPFFGGAEPVIVRKAIRDDQALVVTYHMDTYANGLKGLVFEAHRRALFPWLMARADKILVSSLDYAAASSLGEIDRVQDRIVELPFGVDLQRFHPRTEQEEMEPTILFVGGLDKAHAFKGVPVLLEALARIKDQPWRLVIAGDGELRPSFERMTGERMIAQHVQFLGSVSDADLPGVFRAADIHVLPSTTRGEAFGLVALEAAASGIPSVVSDLPGVRTVVVQNETGVRVPPSDPDALAKALAQLLADGPLRARLGTAARARAERVYAWDPLMEKLVGVYEAVAKRAQAA